MYERIFFMDKRWGEIFFCWVIWAVMQSANSVILSAAKNLVMPEWFAVTSNGLTVLGAFAALRMAGY